MKKLAIVFVLGLMILASSAFGEVQALMVENPHNVSGLWTVETDGDYYAELHLDFQIGYISGFQFIVPSYPTAYVFDNTSVSTDSVIELYDGVNLLYSYPLSNWVDFTDLENQGIVGYIVKVDLGTQGAIYDLNLYGDRIDLDLGDCDSAVVKVYQSFGSIPTNQNVTWIVAWQTLATSWEYDLGRWVYYYSQMALYDSEFSVYGFSEPTAPPAPTDYTFKGWKTITGDFFDFDAGITDPDWLELDEDGYEYLRLWASFVNLYDPSIELPQNPTDNSPTGFLDILDAFGLDDDGGKMIVFYVIALVAVFGLLAIKPIRENPFVIVIVLVALTALFMFLGWLPVWSSVITFLILAYAGLKTLGMTPTTSRED